MALFKSISLILKFSFSVLASWLINIFIEATLGISASLLYLGLSTPSGFTIFLVNTIFRLLCKHFIL